MLEKHPIMEDPNRVIMQPESELRKKPDEISSGFFVFGFQSENLVSLYTKLASLSK